MITISKSKAKGESPTQDVRLGWGGNFELSNTFQSFLEYDTACESFKFSPNIITRYEMVECGEKKQHFLETMTN